MQNKMSIWIIPHPWPDIESGCGYEWELYINDKPIAKSSPTHGDSYFFHKRSAIAAAIRMRKLLFPNMYGKVALRVVCPITDVVNRGLRGQKVRLI